jgi:hypothetical protein
MPAMEKVLAGQRAWQEIPADDEKPMKIMALESLSSCAEAVVVLSENLKRFGYVWVSSEPIPADQLESNIQQIEAKTGLIIPTVLVEFWKIIGGISFVDLETYEHVGFWHKHKIRPPKGFADGLHVDPCINEWAAHICEDFEGWRDYDRVDEGEEYLLSLSPDGFHKDNISGGAPYGVFSGSSWKPIWRNFEWSGRVRPVTALADPPDFLSYLRTTILECAGFPGLLGVPGFDPIRETLLQDVPVF